MVSSPGFFRQPQEGTSEKSSSELANEMVKTLGYYEKTVSKMPGPDCELAKKVISENTGIIKQNAVPAAETDLEADSGKTFSH